MKFSSIDLKNKYMCFENIALDFSKTGIYLIKGANGVGKTSLMKQIVFGQNKVIGNSKEQEEAYEKQRAGLIGYVSQNVIAPSVPVEDYLTKGNQNVDIEELYMYLHKFELGHISLKDNVKRLSGGEITKLKIISVLLKHTPYIFMDEPTNNLDDGSVARFCELMDEIKNKVTIVIITHDTRVQFEGCSCIRVEENGVAEPENKGIFCENKRLNTGGPAQIKASPFRMAFKIQNSVLNNLIRVLISIVLLIMMILNYNEFSTNYARNAMPNENSILIYQADLVYSELNERYAEGVGVHVDSPNYYSLVSYSDIPEIAQMQGVQEVYLLDEEYLNGLVEKMYDYDVQEDEINMLAIPSRIYENYSNELGLQDMFSLESGRMPRDGADEIVLSTNILKQKLRIPEQNIHLGMKVMVNGEQYDLVGIGINDIGWASYENFFTFNIFKV